MYKKEELKFLNMDKFNPITGKGKVFSIENELTIDDKIRFIDEVKDGVATYLLNILNKWENEKETLPKDNYGGVKTVSKKAWIKRNDTRKIIDIDFNIGKYYLFGTKYEKMSLICPTSEYGNRFMYTDSNIVNQWFHDLCVKLYQEEKAYFKTVDPIHIKIKEVKDYANRYHIYFDSKKVNDIAWNGDENATESELDIYLEAYKKIETYINDITKEVKSKLNVQEE